MTTTCLLAWAAVLLLLPVLILLNLTESRSVKIRRARANGCTWAAIAKKYGVSPSTAKRWAAA